jgi:hypothetical protein
MTAGYRRNPRIIDRIENDGECYLFDPQTARFRRLNRVGTDIWNLLNETGDIDAIADRLLHRYKGVDRSRLCLDIKALLERMAAAELVEHAA